jgi:hypothetical protein
VVLQDPVAVAEVFLACLLFAAFMGTVFVLIALLAKKPGVSIALYVIFYFAYTVTSQILVMLSGLTGSEVLADVGRAMGFVDAFTDAVLGVLSNP